MFLQGTDASMSSARKQKVKQTIPGLKAATEEGGGQSNTHSTPLLILSTRFLLFPVR